MKTILSMPSEAEASNLEGAADIQVEKIVGIFLASILVDAVPRGDVDDAIATAKHFRQLRPVENGSVNELSWTPIVRQPEPSSKV